MYSLTRILNMLEMFHILIFFFNTHECYILIMNNKSKYKFEILSINSLINLKDCYIDFYRLVRFLEKFIDIKFLLFNHTL